VNKILMIVASGLLLVGVAAGCTDTTDLEDRLDAVEQQLSGVNEQLTSVQTSSQNGSMLASLVMLQGAGLHEIDEMAAAGQLVEGTSGGVDRAILAVSATAWPEDLQPLADDLLAKLEALATALDSADAATVAGPAADAHSAWHDFEHEASAYLGGEEHDEGEETHDETPAEGEEHMEEETPVSDGQMEEGG
jgi:hypothetical protein